VPRSGARTAASSPATCFKSKSGVADTIYVCPAGCRTIRALSRIRRRSDSRRSPAYPGKARKSPDRFGQIETDRSQSKTPFKINKLSICFNHAYVLFVQHPSKNARNGAFPSGSFVACAGSFGNCGGATEGGIPKSSRLGRSLKSLAFMRVCPKARCD
jgi:hypothetical protein